MVLHLCDQTQIPYGVDPISLAWKILYLPTYFLLIKLKWCAKEKNYEGETFCVGGSRLFHNNFAIIYESAVFSQPPWVVDGIGRNKIVLCLPILIYSELEHNWQKPTEQTGNVLILHLNPNDNVNENALWKFTQNVSCRTMHVSNRSFCVNLSVQLRNRCFCKKFPNVLSIDSRPSSCNAYSPKTSYSLLGISEKASNSP